MVDIFRNPIIIGLIVAVAVYGYMYWDNEQKYKNNPKINKKQVNIITPLIIGVLAWFIAASYLGDTIPVSGSSSSGHSNDYKEEIELPVSETKYLLKQDGGSKLDTFSGGFGAEKNSVNLLGRHKITLPNTDVLINLAKF